MLFCCHSQRAGNAIIPSLVRQLSRKAVRVAVRALLVATFSHKFLATTPRPPGAGRSRLVVAISFAPFGARATHSQEATQLNLRSREFFSTPSTQFARNRRPTDEDGKRNLVTGATKTCLFSFRVSQGSTPPRPPRPNIQFGARRRANRQHLLFRGNMDETRLTRSHTYSPTFCDKSMEKSTELE